MQNILGEGGGTKTDWRIIENGQVIESFQTRSYHPTNWNSTFFDEVAQFWNSKIKAEYKITLYLAGCYRQERKLEFEQELLQRGLRFLISSDLHSAGIAAYGLQGNGWCAIAGTGSVLFHFNAGEITEIRGGKGHVHGDEGSAYYFGKLILEDKSSLNSNEFPSLSLPSKEESTTPKLDCKLEVAALAAIYGNDSSFQPYHRRNIELFANAHQLNDVQDLCFIGTYAFHQQRLFSEILTEQFGINCRFIAEPIVKLTEYQASIFE